MGNKNNIKGAGRSNAPYLVAPRCHFFWVRPAGRTYLEVKVLYSPGKGKS
jgi:hypothetical protein